MSPEDRIAQLEARLAAAEARIAVLEACGGYGGFAGCGGGGAAFPMTPEPLPYRVGGTGLLPWEHPL